MKTRYLFIISIWCLICASCVKELDFNQASDLEFSPTFVASLAKFTITAKDLVENSTELTELTDTSKFTVLDNWVAQDQLEKVTFQIKVSNEFERDFELFFTFYDATDTVTYTSDTITIAANSKDFSYEEELFIVSSRSFLNSEFIETTVRLKPSDDGSVIDEKGPQKFNFQSAATLYLKFD